MGLRLGIDLDGVVADFNRGWTSAYNLAFDATLAPEMVVSWNSPLALTHFTDMDAFWSWAQDHGGHSVFRYLEAYPGATETLRALNGEGHDIVIVTAKPDWAVHDTLEWLADHRVPMRQIHFTEDKHTVACDVYLDDAPHQVRELAEHRGATATVCRFVRAWNQPVAGAHDVHGWQEFHDLVRTLAPSATTAGHR
jgi:5'(3')-deoxyribonucleotidase